MTITEADAPAQPPPAQPPPAQPPPSQPPPAHTPRAQQTRLRRFAARARTTPGHLSIAAAALVVLGVASGVVGWGELQQRARPVQDMSVDGRPLDISALVIYRSLSDADATAAIEFLTGRAGSATLRAQFLADITQATTSMTAAARNAAGDAGSIRELVVLTAQIPVYTAIVATARANNLQGYPVGAAYLREASGLMRGTLLPAAERLYNQEKRRLDQAQSRAADIPGTAIGLAGLTFVGLVALQVFLAYRTRRIVNVGLALAGAAALASVAWIALATLTAAHHVNHGRDAGSAQLQALAEARIAALKSRADEALGLVARGSGEDFEKDFASNADALDRMLRTAAANAPDAQQRSTVAAARAAFDRWHAAHVTMRRLDSDGSYREAVALATGGGAGRIPALFTALDDTLSAGIAQRGVVFGREMDAAERNLVSSEVAVVGLTAVLVVATTLGVRPRVAEYR